MKEVGALIVGGLASFVLLSVLSVGVAGYFDDIGKAAPWYAEPVGLLTCAWIVTAQAARGSFGRMMMGLLTGTMVHVLLNAREFVGRVHNRAPQGTGVFAVALMVAALPVADACGDDVTQGGRFLRLFVTTAILWPFASFLAAGEARATDMLIAWVWPLPSAVAWLSVAPPRPRVGPDPFGEV